MLKDLQKPDSAVVKQRYQAPQLVCYGALTELTQTGSGDMPENTSDCTPPFQISGKSCE